MIPASEQAQGASSRYPMLFRVRQHYDHPRVQDLRTAILEQMERLQLKKTVNPGHTVAITAGSRKISDLALILKCVVDHLKGMDAVPFIVPAMGSQGGATAGGQLAILEAYGIAADQIGCEIRSSMNTVCTGTTEEGIAVHIDKEAYHADHIIVCNRIKPHPSYTGPIESGLMKMLVIGLGNYVGARTYHRAFEKYGFEHVVRGVGQTILAKCPVVAGLAIVENGYGEVAMVEAIAPDQLEEREEQLLVKARQWLPRLPFSEADLLIVDQMGKDISGRGMDPNVIGPRLPRGRRTLPKRVSETLLRSGQAYWDHVLRSGSCEKHRVITHSEFFDTFLHRAFRSVVRGCGDGYGSLGLGRGLPSRRYDEARPPAGIKAYPRIGQVLVRSLTSESFGNADGLDRADLCTISVLEKVDWKATLVNMLATGRVCLPAVHRYYTTDREAIGAVLAGAEQDVERLKVVRIRNTSQIGELDLSMAFREEAAERQNLAILGPAQEMAFDEDGALLPMSVC